MSQALIVATESALPQIRSWVEAEGLSCTAASCRGEAVRLIASRDFELVIINTPTDGEDMASLALTVGRTGAGCILLASANQADELADLLTREGVAVLERPVSHSLFSQALRLMNASRRHVQDYRSEVSRLRAQLDETRLVNRAKCVLIQYLGISEGDAHHYIEKQSMDMRLSRAEIAENILKTYES